MLTRSTFSKLIIPVFVISVLCLSEFCQPLLAFEMSLPGSGNNSGWNRTSSSSKLKPKTKNISEIIANLNYKLEMVLTVANQGNQVGQQDIDVLEEALKEAYSFRSKFERKEMCNYQMLSAWTKYYSGDFKRALADAKAARKTDPDNKDAQATFIAMSLLNKDYKRISIGWEQLSETSLFNKGGSGRSSYSSSARRTQQGSESMLDFHTESVMIDLLGQTIGAGELTCLNGSKVSYNFDGSNALCFLLWKAEAGKLLENSDNKGRSMISTSVNMAASRNSRRKNSKTEDTTTSRIKSYSDLFVSHFENERIRFVGVNLNNIYNKKGVMKQFLTSPWPWAQVMADEPKNEAIVDFLSLRIEDPTVVIIGPEGAIYYAGSPMGFLPKMVLASTFAMGGIESAEPTANGSDVTSNDQGQTETAVAVEQIPEPEQVAEKQVKENKPEELNPRADSLYQMAQFHQRAGKFIGYKKMIEYCRQLFEEYPDSSQAQKAQRLIQKMPERYREQFNVTDEEMGL